MDRGNIKHFSHGKWKWCKRAERKVRNEEECEDHLFCSEEISFMVRNLILQYISILPLPSDTCLLSLISVSAEDFPPLFSFHFSLYSSMPPFSLLSFSHRSLLAQLSSPFIFILKCECCQSVKRIYAFALPSFVIVWLCVYFSVRILSLFPSRARELYVCWEFKLLLYDIRYE